ERVAAEVARILDGGDPAARSTQRRRVSAWRGWSQLAQAGFEPPLVSLVHVASPGRPLGEQVEEVLRASERQTYPRLELVVVAPRDGRTWDDRRDARQRL